MWALRTGTQDDDSLGVDWLPRRELRAQVSDKRDNFTCNLQLAWILDTKAMFRTQWIHTITETSRRKWHLSRPELLSVEMHLHIPAFQHMMRQWLENRRVWTTQLKLNTAFINRPQSLNPAKLWRATHHVTYLIQWNVCPFSIRDRVKCLDLPSKSMYLPEAGAGEKRRKRTLERGTKCSPRQAWQEMYLCRRTLNDHRVKTVAWFHLFFYRLIMFGTSWWDGPG